MTSAAVRFLADMRMLVLLIQFRRRATFQRLQSPCRRCSTRGLSHLKTAHYRRDLRDTGHSLDDGYWKVVIFDESTWQSSPSLLHQPCPTVALS
jgi:hypothetical protein